MKPAILLLAHGTPDSPADVPAYMRNITGGRPIPDSVMEEVQHRYALIGRSPLTDLTLQQARALQQKLSTPVYVGMRNWHPFIADTVTQMRKDGITHITAICLAPQASRTSVGLYRHALEAADVSFAQLRFVESWHDHPLLIEAFAERLKLSRDLLQDAPIIFTAHSVPCRTICSGESGPGDLYSTQAKETGYLVAAKAGVPRARWFFAFQSQGMSGGPWIGPTVEATIEGLKERGEARVLVQPVGFVCDHVEVLYDIDIAFTQYAKQKGVELSRTESLNTSPRFIDALADLATSTDR